MTAVVALFGFVLSLVQQAGILLGVGAEMVLLVSFLLSVHAKTASDGRLVVSARAVERFALWCMILSGAGIVLMHALLGQLAVLFAPAFMGKWLLIGAVLAGYKVEAWVDRNSTFTQATIHGAIGGTWLALFILHLLAPDVPMATVVVGYVVWMLFFAVLWSGFVAALSPRAPKPVKVAAKSVVSTSKLVATTMITPAPAPAPMFTMPTITLPKISIPPITLPKIPMPAPRAPRQPQASVPEIYKQELMAPANAPTHVDAAPAPRKATIAAVPAPKPVVPAPAPAPEQGLPKIWIMPRTPEQVKGAWEF